MPMILKHVSYSQGYWVSKNKTAPPKFDSKHEVKNEAQGEFLSKIIFQQISSNARFE